MASPSDPTASSLTRLWQERWPESPPVAQWIRDAYADRWVRFHSLPGSKRYPETEAEETIMLHRHETVLSELSPDGRLLVLSTAWTDAVVPLPSPPRWPPHQARTASDPSFWRTLPPSEELGECFTHLFFEICPWPFAGLHGLLHAVAHEEIPRVVLGPLELSWLYLPYDGGADVITPTTAERDALRERHADWLSQQPSGL